MSATASPNKQLNKAWLYVLILALVIALVLTVVLSIDDSTAFSPQVVFYVLITAFPLLLVIVLGVAFVFGGKGPRRVRKRAPPPPPVNSEREKELSRDPASLK